MFQKGLLRNRPIGLRILLLALIPFLAALTLASHSLPEQYALSKSASRVAEAVQLSGDISALVHELQKERGMSALFFFACASSPSEGLASGSV